MTTNRILTLQFPFSGCSFQQGHMRFKTPKQKAFETSIIKELLPFRKAIVDFCVGFDPKSEVLETKWVFLYKNFFTKKENTISQQTLDLDNSIKNIQDGIFRHMVNLNDSQVVKTNSFKWRATQDQIIFQIKVSKRDEIEKELELFLDSIFTNDSL